MKSIPELLAPAGSLESFKSAINAGADSIYLSGKKFGARQYADNFTKPEILEAIEYAHLRKVKVYVTVNTLIKDAELGEVAEYLVDLYGMGVDAVLIQDLGLLKIAQELVPALNLHASTQMTIHNQDGLTWAEDNGLKRAVLSRELSLDEIKDLRLKSKGELEIFVHGALCYAYSGQCQLSALIGGRSGNRGRCAQPCRKPYYLLSGEKDSYGRLTKLRKLHQQPKYLLSTKDLALYTKLKKVLASGIDSLKIEGRMRSPEYVFLVVSIYREALDQILAGKWMPERECKDKLSLVFNRGFTKGKAFQDKSKDFMGIEKPGHRGLFLGIVKNYSPKKGRVKIDLNTKIHPNKGDGVYFTAPQQSTHGMDITKHPIIKGRTLSLKVDKPVEIGSKLYLSKKQDLKKDLKSSSVERVNHKIYFSFYVDENKFPLLIGELNDGSSLKLSSQIKGKYPLEPAKKKPISVEQIKNQLLKSGDKPFEIEIKSIDHQEGLYIPLSKLNQLRRDVLADMEDKILKNHRPSVEELKKAEIALKNFKNMLSNKYSHYTEIKTKKELNRGNRPKSTIIKIKELKSGSRSLLNKEDNNFKLKQIQLAVYVDDILSLKKACELDIPQIYFEMPLLTPKQIREKCILKNKNSLIKYDKEKIVHTWKEAQRLAKSTETELIWKWPKITSPLLLKNLKDILRKIAPNCKVMVSHPGIAAYIRNKYPEMLVYGSADLNLWNHCSIKQISSYFSSICISGELSKKDIGTLLMCLKEEPRPSIELMVQGNMEALTSRECLLDPSLIKKYTHDIDGGFYALQDIKNKVFPVKISGECETIILNSVETCLVDYLPYLIKIGVDTFSIDARGRGIEYLQSMVSLYQEAILSILESNFYHSIYKIKGSLKKISQGGITSGNFTRGLEKV